MILLLLIIASSSYAQELVLVSRTITGAVPEDPGAPEWAAVPGIVFPLQPQTIADPGLPNPTVTAVTVRSLTNGKRIAFLLEWADRTRNVFMRTNEFRDAVAIQLPFTQGDMPSPFMGHEGSPVYIMHWKADWQEDIDSGYVDMTRLYPNLWVDFYRDASAARDLKNPMSVRGKTPVEECMAEGFGTLTSLPHQDVSGKGIWKAGVWRVVISRDMDTGNPGDPVLTRGEETIVAFAAWDGEKGTGSRKAWGGWFPFTIPAP